jgi:shikimate kinase
MIQTSTCSPAPDAAVPLTPPRSLVLVGLMGAGKSSVGKRLAARLALPFYDADQEIERAAQLSVEEIFARHGEASFREGERRVIARLLQGPAHVLATGGGAFVDPETRRLVHERAISVWLKVELDELVRRVSRRTNRPLLKGKDPREVLEKLTAERYPAYAEADITVISGDGIADLTAERVIQAVAEFIRSGELEKRA